MNYSSNILPDHANAIERSTLSDLSLLLINTDHIYIYILSYDLPLLWVEYWLWFTFPSIV